MKNQKGITLVALVITIIVLLILAGVSISLVVGNNGVLTQASNSVVTNKAADARQALQMAQAAVETSYYAEWTNNTALTREDTGSGSTAVAGAYSNATTGLIKELDNLGYTIFASDAAAVVQNLLSGTATDLVIQKGSSEKFLFKQVKINKDTGEMTYEGLKKLYVFASDITSFTDTSKAQGSVNL